MVNKKNAGKSFIGYTRELGDGVRRTGRGVYLAALGVVSVAEEQTRGVFSRLVERGERFEKKEGTVIRTTSDRVRKLGRSVEDRVQRTVAGTLRTAGVPSRDEIHDLTRRVEQLTSKVDRLHAAR